MSTSNPTYEFIYNTKTNTYEIHLTGTDSNADLLRNLFDNYNEFYVELMSEDLLVNTIIYKIYPTKKPHEPNKIVDGSAAKCTITIPN